MKDIDEVKELAKAVYQKYYEAPKGFYSSQEVKYMGTTVKSLAEMAPLRNHSFLMGSYICKCVYKVTKQVRVT